MTFYSVGREAAPTFDISTIDGFDEGGYCMVIETGVLKIY